VADFRKKSGPDELLGRHAYLLSNELKDYPILDLACGDGHNGIYLAQRGFPVVLADKSGEALLEARVKAQSAGVSVQFWQVDLEQEGVNPLGDRIFSAVLVYRYLYRPLIPSIKNSLKGGGILFYETFTAEQARFGKPQNPDHLLKAGELFSWFHDWEIIYTFEGVIGAPPKAVARLVSRKPASNGIK
jgi:tellurite methyltransferase